MAKIKSFFLVLFALFTCAIALFATWSMRVSRFWGLEGERCFYLGSASSQAVIKKELSLKDFGKIKGESVVWEIAEGAEEVVERLLERYNATVLFTEKVDGTTSYYCLTSAWADGVRVGEYLVNLHIAVGKGRCAVGAPMIFGGF